MALSDRAYSARLGERQKIIIDAAIAYNNAMRGREITLEQVAEMVAFLNTQLLIVEAELAEERRERRADRDKYLLILGSYKKTTEEALGILERFGYKREDLWNPIEARKQEEEKEKVAK